MEAKPGKPGKLENQIPDLRITHYIQCGKVETEILRHYPMLPAKYSVQVSQNNMVIKEYETTEQFCFMVSIPAVIFL